MIYTCTIGGAEVPLSSFRWFFKEDAVCQLAAELQGVLSLSFGDEVVIDRGGAEIVRVLLDSYTTSESAEVRRTSVIASDTLDFTPLVEVYELHDIMYRSAGASKGLWLYKIKGIDTSLTPGSAVNYLDHTFLIDSIAYDVDSTREHMEIREAVEAA